MKQVYYIILSAVILTAMVSCRSTSKIVLSNNVNIDKYKYVIFENEQSIDWDLDDVLMSVQNIIASTNLEVISLSNKKTIECLDSTLIANIHIVSEKWSGGHTYITVTFYDYKSGQRIAIVKSSGIGFSISQDQSIALNAIKKRFDELFKNNKLKDSYFELDRDLSPQVPNIGLDEIQLKQKIYTQNDGIVGIYEGASGNKYRLACIKDSDEYKLIYLGSKEPLYQWRFGDVKAFLRPSATLGIFKANWYMDNKTSNSDCYIIFDDGSMKTIIDNDEDFYLKMYPTPSMNTDTSSQKEKWSGTGFALKNGYVVTNYHVIENANSIKIQGVNGDFNKQYNATIIATDKYNDLALLQIVDNNFKEFGPIPYNVKTTVSEVGEDIFVLGYPLTSTMGNEIKLTTGVISSKTGFQGDVSLYQISAPIQPGNSGGPLFDNNGNIVGIVNAKHKGAENVSYAIKTCYLKNLIESSISTSILPNSNQTAGLSLTDKVKSIKNYIFLISCSNQRANHIESSNINNYTNRNQQTYVQPSNFIEYPTVGSTTAGQVKIKSIKLTKEYTAIEIISNNQSESTYYQWCNINRNTYISANEIQYKMTKAEGIKIAPEKTYFTHTGENIAFTLYFPSIPESVTSINLIESIDSDWKFYDIKIR